MEEGRETSSLDTVNNSREILCFKNEGSPSPAPLGSKFRYAAEELERAWGQG